MNIVLIIFGYLIIISHKNNGVVYAGGALGLIVGIILYFSVKDYDLSVIGLSIDIGLIVGAIISPLFKIKKIEQ